MAKKKTSKKKAVKATMKAVDIKAKLPSNMPFDEAMERIVRVPPPPELDKGDIN